MHMHACTHTQAHLIIICTFTHVHVLYILLKHSQYIYCAPFKCPLYYAYVYTYIIPFYVYNVLWVIQSIYTVYVST